MPLLEWVSMFQWWAMRDVNLTFSIEAEIEAQRGGGEGKGGARYACPHRDRPIEDSLREFERMRDGHYKAKEASLRMKQDLEDPNPQVRMWSQSSWEV